MDPFGVKVRIFGGNTGKTGNQTVPPGRSQGKLELNKIRYLEKFA